MRAVVVYESSFGNTQALARAVAEGLRTRFEVTLLELVGRAPVELAGVDLLVVGGPVHAWSMTREGIAAATFDTALRTSWFPTGSAANPAARRLEAHGYRLLVKPEHFYLTATDGPLDDGELARARAWGVGLADVYLRSINNHAASRSGM